MIDWGMPAATIPINSRMELHEQHGVATPSTTARKSPSASPPALEVDAELPRSSDARARPRISDQKQQEDLSHVIEVEVHRPDDTSIADGPDPMWRRTRPTPMH